MSILIKNGRIITATDDYLADIYIEGETISAIGKNLNVKADQEIDAKGKLVMPGGIDPHVHLDMPFMGTYSSDNYETGTRAALFGGTTTVIDFILQTQGKSLQSALQEWKGRSDNNAVGDYSFHMAVTDFNDETKNVVKVSIWRQKQRLRVYVNETKIWDIPKAFSPASKYNFFGFSTDGYHGKEDAYFLSNIRVAVGAQDTRHKFLELGKYSTTGIKFDVNSDKIKGESYGTLKDFAAVMTENPDVKVKIVGHTDSDGDDVSNLTLSKKRADAVKAALNKEFGIDNSRMETEGKGETQPAEANTSAEGKANNRRVEFIKL